MQRARNTICNSAWGAGAEPRLYWWKRGVDRPTMGGKQAGEGTSRLPLKRSNQAGGRDAAAETVPGTPSGQFTMLYDMNVFRL